ncbi:MAG: hypothetical protein PHH47_04715 [Gallionella sp.]|nr:hypothetical protein [Gallionella sp.]MDD4945428.1 hypothetical protein [Gallionella sp.]MDD5612185.1 hypothetical protein [Gallionella sp.]
MNNTKRLIAATATLLLCACNNVKLPAIMHTANAPQPASVTKPATVAEPTADSAFKEQVIIKPSESVEKDQLQVSYSIKAVPNEANSLLLSLTFRNLKSKSVKLRPRIVLSDAEGKPVAAYSKQSFIKQARLDGGGMSSKAPSSDQKAQRIKMEEKVKWANSFWLKEHFNIPANGIEVGEIVFHCKTACQPQQLNVYIGKQQFPFVISAPSRN